MGGSTGAGGQRAVLFLIKKNRNGFFHRPTRTCRRRSTGFEFNGGAWWIPPLHMNALWRNACRNVTFISGHVRTRVCVPLCVCTPTIVERVAVKNDRLGKRSEFKKHEKSTFQRRRRPVALSAYVNVPSRKGPRGKRLCVPLPRSRSSRHNRNARVVIGKCVEKDFLGFRVCRLMWNKMRIIIVEDWLIVSGYNYLAIIEDPQWTLKICRQYANFLYFRKYRSIFCDTV